MMAVAYDVSTEIELEDPGWLYEYEAPQLPGRVVGRRAASRSHCLDGESRVLHEMDAVAYQCQKLVEWRLEKHERRTQGLPKEKLHPRYAHKRIFDRQGGSAAASGKAVCGI